MTNDNDLERQKGFNQTKGIQSNLRKFFPRKPAASSVSLAEKYEQKIKENLTHVAITKIGCTQDIVSPINLLEKREGILKDREENIRKLIADTLVSIDREPTQVSPEESETIKKLSLNYLLGYKKWNDFQVEAALSNNTPVSNENNVLLPTLKKSQSELNGYCKQLADMHHFLVDPSLWECMELLSKDNGLLELANLIHNQRKHRIDQIMNQRIEEINKRFLQKLKDLNLPTEEAKFKPVIPLWNA